MNEKMNFDLNIHLYKQISTISFSFRSNTP